MVGLTAAIAGVPAISSVFAGKPRTDRGIVVSNANILGVAVRAALATKGI